MIIVGFSGYARCGKDTAADYLAERYGFEHRAFADKLRDALYVLNPIVVLPHKRLFGRASRLVRVRDFVNARGSTNLPETVASEIARLRQLFITKVGPCILGMELTRDVVEKLLYALNPIVVLPHKRLFGHVPELVRANDFVTTYGYERAKEIQPELRALLQRLGTEAGRDILGENVWVNACLRDAPERLTISDTRFTNEALTIKARGGIVVRVSRPGYGPINDHSSETGLESFDFDARIENDSTLADFYRKIDVLVSTINGVGGNGPHAT